MGGGRLNCSVLILSFCLFSANVTFLQETHLRTGENFRMRKDWVGQVFHFNFHSKSRGAAILVDKSTPFVASEVITDPKGRYVIVTGKRFFTLQV